MNEGVAVEVTDHVWTFNLGYIPDVTFDNRAHGIGLSTLIPAILDSKYSSQFLDFLKAKPKVIWVALCYNRL